MPATVVDDPVAALSRLAADRQRQDDPILVAGSLYLVGAVRAKALELSKQPGTSGPWLGANGEWRHKFDL